jgi:hypothetical protein
VLHQFLTNYSPASSRVYAFVEGEPDRLFYRRFIERFGVTSSDLFVYNCDGKESVYRAYSDVVVRYPNCIRVLFFVDKDLDDIVGRQWPADPRVFVTQVYSVENYVVGRDAMKRYFEDFAKLRRVNVSIDTALDQFECELHIFYRLIRPLMAWIISARRSGATLNLNNLDLENLFQVTDVGIRKRRVVNRLDHIRKMTQVNQTVPVWRQVRATCVELKRMQPKRFVRGKFEAWMFIHSAMRIADALKKISTEGGGSVAFSAQLTQSTFIQLLCPIVSAPKELDTFLRFHLLSSAKADDSKSSERKTRFLSAIMNWWEKQ